MDISYLLFLQDFRNSIHDALTPFLEGVSLFAITYILLIPIFIYWCVNKRSGLYTLASFALCTAVNSIIKLTVCAYRPWIRDPRVIPAGNAIATAGGYSFPSGHTTMATPLYGGMAVGFWQKTTTKWLSLLCVVAILITGFSRNYLGVHTPQDVGVGFILGVLSLWVMWKAFAYFEKHPQAENKWLLIGFIGGLLALVYINVKPYPLNYIDGKLLVDPQRMMNDAYKDIGIWLAFCAARYVDKRWIHFESTGLNVRGVVTGLVGLIPVGLMVAYLTPWCVALCGPHMGRLFFSFIFVAYVMVLYPVILKWVSAKHTK